jgi:hypothetical protein
MGYARGVKWAWRLLVPLGENLIEESLRLRDCRRAVDEIKASVLNAFSRNLPNAVIMFEGADVNARNDF